MRASRISLISSFFVTMADGNTGDSRPSNHRHQPIFETGLTEEIEIKLIEFFKENPCLFDKSNEQHKRRDIKDRILSEKAEELRGLGLRPCNPEVLRRWFRSQRTSYNRVISKKSGDGAKRLTSKDLWLKERFSFLSQYHRNSESRVSNVSIYITYIYVYMLLLAFVIPLHFASPFLIS